MRVRESVFPVQRDVILGALGAALSGGLFALEFDRIAAIGEHLLGADGQAALLDALGTAALVGLLVGGAAVLVVRTIRRHAVRPYLILTEQLEGTGGSPLDLLRDLRHPPAVHRLARAVLAARDETAATQRAAAELRSRYDALTEANVRERENLMAILMEKAGGRVATTPASPPLLSAPMTPFAIPDRPPLPAPAQAAIALLTAPIVIDDLFGPLRLSAGCVRVTTH